MRRPAANACAHSAKTEVPTRSTEPPGETNPRSPRARPASWGKTTSSSLRCEHGPQRQVVDVGGALCRAAPVRDHIPQRSVDQCAVQRVEVRQQRGNLGKQRVGENRCHFLIAPAAGVAHQLAHLYFESDRETLAAIRASESPCRSRSSRCRYEAPACGPPTGAG